MVSAQVYCLVRNFWIFFGSVSFPFFCFQDNINMMHLIMICVHTRLFLFLGFSKFIQSLWFSSLNLFFLYFNYCYISFTYLSLIHMLNLCYTAPSSSHIWQRVPLNLWGIMTVTPNSIQNFIIINHGCVRRSKLKNMEIILSLWLFNVIKFLSCQLW